MYARYHQMTLLLVGGGSVNNKPSCCQPAIIKCV